jgi:orotate phosphoribosyltransferase
MSNLDTSRATLLAELREHALVIGEVTLSSGQQASYYVDARRALLRPPGFRAVGELLAVGGPVMAAIPLACATIAVPDGAELVGFFVRNDRKQHGLQRWIEGPVEAGARCLVVEDTVTTGRSTVSAIERMRAEGLEVAAAVCVVDRLAGGGEAIAEAAGAPFRALVTIDELYPDRPDRDS